MNYNHNTPVQVTTFNIKLDYFILLAIVFLACKNQEDHASFTLPSGKWKAISLKNSDRSFVFDTNGNYFVELNLENRLIVTAEDNLLSGNLIGLSSDTLKMRTIELTDVCCNSDTANTLFQFFNYPIKYVQQGNQLTLTSEKGVLELGKK